MNRPLIDFESAFGQMAVGMAQVGLDSTFLRVNKKFCQMLGYEKSELEGKTFNSITHKDDQQKSLDIAKLILESREKAVSFEKRYITKTGQAVWCRVTTAVVLGSESQPQHFVTVLEDITKQKQQEKDSSDQRLRMVAASKINGVGRLAAGMAHEINNPLTIVMGQASRLKKMAQEENLNPKQVLAMSEQIEVMASRIAEIINGLRNFAREGSDEPILKTSLRQILSDALKFIRAKIVLKQIELIVDEGTEDVFLSCRGVQVTQALLNVINNAKDALEGRKKSKIELRIFSDKDSVGFEVHDNGPGVEKDQQPFLFQPFFTTKSVGLGTGLGLSITKDIVEKYNGKITYKTSHLGGAFFKISFPR